MKVLYLDQSGEIMNKFICSLGNGLCRAGIDFTLCVPETNRMFGYNDSYVTLFEDFSILSSPIQKALSYQRSWKRIYQYCLREKVDIIHVSWFTLSPLDYFYLSRLQKHNIRIVITIHDVLAYDAHFFDKVFYKKIYHLGNQIIYQAQAYEAELQNTYELSESRLNYIPHGNFIDYRENLSFEDAREQLDIALDAQVILFFGQIKKNKGLSVLIDAFARLVAENPQAILLIAGKVWKDSFEGYQLQIDSIGIQERIVEHIRYIPDEDIKYYLTAADIVALPYSKIYQSGVLQLATAYVKPIIASRIPGFIEYIVDGETGLLFEEGNAVALAGCMKQILSNPNTGHQLAVAAKERAEREYSWERVAEKVVEVYKEAAR